MLGCIVGGAVEEARAAGSPLDGAGAAPYPLMRGGGASGCTVPTGGGALGTETRPAESVEEGVAAAAPQYAQNFFDPMSTSPHFAQEAP